MDSLARQQLVSRLELQIGLHRKRIPIVMEIAEAYAICQQDFYITTALFKRQHIYTAPKDS